MVQSTLIKSSFWTTDVRLSAFLVFLLLLIFVLYPIGELGIAGGALVEVLFSVMLITGVLSVSGNRSVLIAMIVLAITAFLSGLLALIYPNLVLFIVRSILASLLIGALVVIIMVEVFSEGRITFHRIQGAIGAYLLVGVLWAMLYRLVDQLNAGVFLRAPDMIPPRLGSILKREYIYFSFGALTTVEYKGLSAVHPLSQSLVMMEALIGQLFPAILLARLVSMEVEARRSDKADGRRISDNDETGSNT